MRTVPSTLSLELSIITSDATLQESGELDFIRPEIGLTVYTHMSAHTSIHAQGTLTLDVKLKDSGLAIVKGSTDKELTASLTLDNDGWHIVEVPRCPPLTTLIVRYHYNHA